MNDKDSILITSSRQAIATGTRVRVYNLHLRSGTAANPLQLLSGGSGGTVYIEETGTANTGKTFDYGVEGHIFPDGVYATLASGNVSALISYKVIL